MGFLSQMQKPTHRTTPTYAKSARERQTLCCQPVNPMPQTLNPKLQTPNSKPQTLNPKPQTANPKPQTPNPKLQTLNFEPQTPNSEPKTSEPYIPNLWPTWQKENGKPHAANLVFLRSYLPNPN